MRCLFVHINKTGGNSIEKALGLPFQHITAKEFISAYGMKVWNESFKFTVVRNPWDKVVSHYHYRIMTNQTGLGSSPIDFTEWVKRAYGENDPHYYDIPKMFMPQVDWLTDNDGKITVNHIARFENLDRDFKRLCVKLRVIANLPHIKSSNRDHFRRYYDKVSTDIVSEWFAQDIKTFSYRFE